MASLAESAQRIGIPLEMLEELIELPVVAQAVQSAMEHPNWSPKSIWKGVGRPTVYQGGEVKVEILIVELAKRQELATRSTDGRIVMDRHGSPISTGRLQKAEKIARRRFTVISEVEKLLRDHFAEPNAMSRATSLLRQELKVSEGGDL